MDKEWTDIFLEEIKDLRKAIDAFDRGDIDRREYKKISGGFGSYAQREDGKHMLRLRLPGGRLTLARLEFLAETIEKARVGRVKLTTCETIQLHDLSADRVPDIVEEAAGRGIYTKGGGGDYPRNVMASPLSGVQQGEAFDVLPYAEETTRYLLSVIRDIRMPRKLKIAFCNGADDCVHSAFRDMGFLAQPDGTFALRIAGGLGALNPSMGLLVEEHIQPRETLYYVRAMADVFGAYGNYESRTKSRTRFLQDTLGKDGLREIFLKQAEALKAEGGLEISEKGMKSPGDAKQPDTGTVGHSRVIAQKQSGLYAVKYHPIGGLLPAEKPRRLYELLSDMHGVELRVAPDETLYIINLTSAEAKRVLEETADGARTEVEYSVACVGSAICQQGFRDSQGVLRAVIAAVRKTGIADGALPKICISGCPSGCAAHQAGVIGFQGSVKKVGEERLPAFKMTVGGSDRLGGARFGEGAATVLERDMPALLTELGGAAQASGQRWEQWHENHAQEFEDIVAKYS